MDSSWNGVKVLSATKFQDRAILGERVTEWMFAHRHVSIVDVVVTQSSDSSFHCVAVSIFYREETRAPKR